MNYVRPEVFISFASPDFPVAKQIADDLSSRGIRTFLAPRDIKSGENFALQIVTAISTCDVVLLLLSKAAAESPHVRREVSIAIDERRHLLPYAMPGIDYPTGLAPEWTYWLSAVQVTTFRGVPAVLEDVTRAVRPPASVPGGSATPLPPAIAASESAPQPTPVDRESRRVPLRRKLAPSALLRAELDTVPLIGRDEELLRLELWATKDDDFDARLLVGGAGQGKSRLARELSVRLAEAGWATKNVSSGETGLSVAQSLPSQPTLVVIDYAETRVAQVGDVLEALDQIGMPDRVRILLLARSTSDWWKRLTSRSAVIDGMLDGVTVQTLAPLTTNQAVVQQLYRAASDGFKAALGIDTPTVQEPFFRSYSSVLDVVETALVDVLAGSPRESETTVTSRLLAHERRYVRVAVEAEGITDVDAADLERIMVMFTLFGAQTEEAALALLSYAHLGVSPATLRKIARLFRSLYPGTDMYIYGLRPDTLACDFIAQVADEETALFNDADLWRAATTSPASLQRGILVLTRAAAQYESVRGRLRNLIVNGDLATLESAIEVASQVEDARQLLAFLSEAITKIDTSISIRQLFERVPSETVNLANLAAELADKVVETLPPDHEKTVADVDLLLACSNRFSDVGWGVRAADTARQAIAVLERTQEDTPRAEFTLARALSNLSNRYWEIGRLSEALAPAVRSVHVFRELPIPEGHDLETEYAICFAEALNNLAFRLAEVAEFDGAVQLASESYDRLRDLTGRGISAAQAGLGAALNNLTCIYLGLGRPTESLRTGMEAVSLRRSQAFSDRDHYLPYVARTLANTAAAAMSDGDTAGALAMIEEARALQSITGQRAPIFRYEEAESAVICSILFATAGEHERAAEALGDAQRLLKTIEGQLSLLTIGLAETIANNILSLQRAKGATWQDVSVGHHLVGHESQPTTLALPILLEYKDL